MNHGQVPKIIQEVHVLKKSLGFDCTTFGVSAKVLQSFVCERHYSWFEIPRCCWLLRVLYAQNMYTTHQQTFNIYILNEVLATLRTYFLAKYEKESDSLKPSQIDPVLAAAIMDFFYHAKRLSTLTPSSLKF